MLYDGVNVNDLNVSKPTEGATPPSELNDSDREIKTVFKNQYAIATKTAAYTLLGSDHIILANGTFEITLPTASTVAGSGYKKEYVVINIGTGTITITGTVDGASNPTLTTQYSSITIETDGTNYYSVGINSLLKTGGSLTGALNEAYATVASHATTAPIWAALGNVINYTGTEVATAFPNATQAGARRTLICAAACGFTAGANMLINGTASAATYTAAAGDRIEVEALSTTQFKLTIIKYDGKAVVGESGFITSVTGTAPIASSGGATPAISLNDASISQSKLKSTTGELTCFNSGDVITESDTTLPGGEYGFTPQWKAPYSDQFTEVYASMLKKPLGTPSLPISYASQIYLYVDRTGSSFDGRTLYVQQRYIQASPPYEAYRKNDAVPLFVFGLVEKSTGKIFATYIAPEPPWANNGPTVINPLGLVQRMRKQKSGVNMADLRTGKTKPKDFGFLLENYEEPTKEELKAALAIPITQADKNADMPLIPHPFNSYNPAKHVVVVLSPTDEKFCNGLLRLHEMGESVSEVLYGDYITIDNTPMKGLITPESVMAVNARWKIT